MADEARAMLDALMGGDRNAPIPRGAAVPKNNQGSSPSSSSQQGPFLPGQRKRSCYDPSICPLYCAWGVDVYDLFTNTKSDLGPNPKLVDQHARQEFESLPDHEKERLGYQHMLFVQLQDLVRSCQRTVSRNREKLRSEISRQQSKNRAAGIMAVTNDPVLSIPEEGIEKCAHSMAELELLEEEIQDLLQKIRELSEEEKDLRSQKQTRAESQKNEALQDQEIANEQGNTEINEPKGEQSEAGTPQPNGDDRKEGETVDRNDETPTQDAENAEPNGTSAETEDALKVTEAVIKQDIVEGKEEERDPLDVQLEELLTKKKWPLLEQLRLAITAAQPLGETIEAQKRQLYYFRTDTTSDKTVCEISGNFMSSRDADERIAAHFAGKQYVGWKMVRDKHKEMVKQFGPSGPPHPGGRGGGGQQGYGYDSHDRYGGGGGGGYGGGWDDRGRGGGRDRDHDRGGNERSRSGERDRRGGGTGHSRNGGSSRGNGGRSSSPPTWERDRGSSSSSRGYGGGSGSSSSSKRDRSGRDRGGSGSSRRR